MNINFHEKYKFGILYPNHIKGLGSPDDILAFFQAIEIVSTLPREEFPLLLLLREKPIFGEVMMPMFEQAKNLYLSFKKTKITSELVAELGLDKRETGIDINCNDLAAAFEGIFSVLVDDAPSWVSLQLNKPDNNILQWGAVRLGPIEPMIIGSLFKKLKEEVFENYSDPPLWLRDEIFDTNFYKGKI